MPRNKYSAPDDPSPRRSIHLSLEQKRDYLWNDNHCPVCGAKEIESLDNGAFYVSKLNMNGDSKKDVHHGIGCNKCWAEWEDVYHYFDYDKVEIDKKHPYEIENVTVKSTNSIKFILED